MPCWVVSQFYALRQCEWLYQWPIGAFQTNEPLRQQQLQEPAATKTLMHWFRITHGYNSNTTTDSVVHLGGSRAALR